jgi:hypothetical protein
LSPLEDDDPAWLEKQEQEDIRAVLAALPSLVVPTRDADENYDGGELYPDLYSKLEERHDDDAPGQLDEYLEHDHEKLMREILFYRRTMKMTRTRGRTMTQQMMMMIGQPMKLVETPEERLQVTRTLRVEVTFQRATRSLGVPRRVFLTGVHPLSEQGFTAEHPLPEQGCVRHFLCKRATASKHMVAATYEPVEHSRDAGAERSTCWRAVPWSTEQTAGISLIMSCTR